MGIHTVRLQLLAHCTVGICHVEAIGGDAGGQQCIGGAELLGISAIEVIQIGHIAVGVAEVQDVADEDGRALVLEGQMVHGEHGSVVAVRRG